jgi:hypothetical protein
LIGKLRGEDPIGLLRDGENGNNHADNIPVQRVSLA